MRRRGRIVAAVVLLLVGLLAALIVFGWSRQRVEDAAAAMARAPVGCTTSLTFADAGTYWLYVEPRGRSESVPAGDCDVPARWEIPSPPPAVDLALTDPQGVAVVLRGDTSRSYDEGPFAGQSVSAVDVPAPGTYALTVRSEGSGFVVAVGRDPGAAGTAAAVMAVIIAALTVVLAVVLLVSGVRRQPLLATPLPTLPLRDPLSTPTPRFDAPAGPSPWAPPGGSAPLSVGTSLPPPPPSSGSSTTGAMPPPSLPPPVP